MTIILKNALFADWRTLALSTQDITVQSSQEMIIDCTGKLVTRPFSCGHHHAYSALARGMGSPKKTPRNFHEILKYIWWTLDKCLDRDMIKLSALVTAMQCVRNGVACVIDHHASPFAIDGALEIMAQAFDEIGVRHLLCYEISDRDGKDISAEGLAETEHYLASGRNGLVGLHASFTVHEDTLRDAVSLAQKFNSGIHVHTAEDGVDQEMTRYLFNKSVAQRWEDAGVLAMNKTILAHCLHLDQDEKLLLASSNVWIAENMESNLNNSVGLFDGTALGDRIMLGTDGMHSDMLRSMKAAFFNGGHEPLSMDGAYQRLRNTDHYLVQNGVVPPESDDFVVLAYDTPTPVTQENLAAHFIYGIESRHVHSLIVNGRVVMHNRMIMTADEESILRFARDEAQKLWQKMNKSDFY